MYAFAPSAAPLSLRTSLRASKFVSAQTTPRVAAVARRATAPTMLLSPEITAATFPLAPLAADMRVTFPAYLAVFLGTLIPVAFLIILFIQSEARNSGERTGRGE
jgi:photosystem II reaction center protein PsbM